MEKIYQGCANMAHFDNHTLVSRPLFMDDNARPHRSGALKAYLENESVLLDQQEVQILTL